MANVGAALALLLGLRVLHLRHRRAGLDPRVVFLDQRQRLLRIKVAREVNGRVVGRVVGAEVLEAVFLGDVLDVLHPADHRPAVGVGLEDQGAELLVHHSHDLIVDPQPSLFDHHLSLALEHSVADRQ